MTKDAADAGPNVMHGTLSFLVEGASDTVSLWGDGTATLAAANVVLHLRQRWKHGEFLHPGSRGDLLSLLLSMRQASFSGFDFTSRKKPFFRRPPSVTVSNILAMRKAFFRFVDDSNHRPMTGLVVEGLLPPILNPFRYTHGPLSP